MESPLLDHSQLETFTAIGYDDYLDLLGDVIQDVPGHLEHIRSAVHQENAKELGGRAHSFRGMLSYFGCIALTARLAELERHPIVASHQAAGIHSELQALWELSLAAIKEWEKSVPDFAPE